MENKQLGVLVGAGLKKNEAKVLLFLFTNKKTVSRAIEEEAIMRQPEVSNVMATFLERRWITKKRKAKTFGKGRPEILFSLAKSKEEILYELKDNLIHDSNLIQKRMVAIDKLLKV